MNLENLDVNLVLIVIAITLMIINIGCTIDANRYAQNGVKSNKNDKYKNRIPECSKKKKKIKQEECVTNYPVITGAAVSGSCLCCIVLAIILVFVAIHLKVPPLIKQLVKLTV